MFLINKLSLSFSIFMLTGAGVGMGGGCFLYNKQSIKFYRWRVGIPFIKNHLFVFDQDKKSIGIYIKKKSKKGSQ